MSEIIKEKLYFSDSASKTPLVTVITPTYNRAHTLKKCFDSLVNQTCNDFQWLIIDDGSTDGTEALLDRLKNDARLPFDYVLKENGGKHTALNVSHKYIKGKYVVVLDSDDTFTPDAVATIIGEWQKYDSDKSVNILYFYRKTPQNEFLCYVKTQTPLQKHIACAVFRICTAAIAVMFSEPKCLKNIRSPCFRVKGSLAKAPHF